VEIIIQILLKLVSNTVHLPILVCMKEISKVKENPYRSSLNIRTKASAGLLNDQWGLGTK
jgi:hypothetical protein